MSWSEKKTPSHCSAARWAEERAQFSVLFGQEAARVLAAVVIFHFVNYLGRSELSV